MNLKQVKLHILTFLPFSLVLVWAWSVYLLPEYTPVSLFFLITTSLFGTLYIIRGFLEKVKRVYFRNGSWIGK